MTKLVRSYLSAVGILALPAYADTTRTIVKTERETGKHTVFFILNYSRSQEMQEQLYWTDLQVVRGTRLRE